MKTFENETMTWQTLRDALNKLPEKQLHNPVMIYLPDADEFCPAELLINKEASMLQKGEPYLLADVDMEEGDAEEEE